jgi:hypothetical protein
MREAVGEVAARGTCRPRRSREPGTLASWAGEVGPGGTAGAGGLAAKVMCAWLDAQGGWGWVSGETGVPVSAG